MEAFLNLPTLECCNTHSYSGIKILLLSFLLHDIPKFSAWAWSVFLYYCPLRSGGERITLLWVLFTITPTPPKVKTEYNVTEQCTQWSAVVCHKPVLQCHSCKCHLGKSVSLLELLELRASDCYHLQHQVRLNKFIFDRFKVSWDRWKDHLKGLKINRSSVPQ